MRNAAREIFQYALEQCNIASAFARDVSYERGVLRIREDLFALDRYLHVFAVSVGKAAHAMAEALVQQVGTRVYGVVVSSVEPANRLSNFTYFQGGHPLPNEDSLRGARQILSSLAKLGDHDLVIFMISGGGSSMLEKPLDEGVSLSELVETYRVLVHSGAPIAEINAIRKHLSAVKGGRLAAAAALAQQVSILVSDVPENALDSLASGPTMPDSSTVEDCYAIAAKHGLRDEFPTPVKGIFRQRALAETPKSDDVVFVRSRWWPILSSGTAAEAAARKAVSLGFAVEIDSRCDDWDYMRAADYLLQRVRETRSRRGRACVISAGEVTVRVSGESGRGGRNQQFALYCATRIEGENMVVLSAGTDGIDGNSEAAGAVVDGTTVTRVREAGLDPKKGLAGFDAFPIFQQLGDAIVTGPTGTNVRDVRVLLAW
ncbi:MAG TPA: DUF4147 domain-containing protein [Terriglobales bacterium]|nr:DUF4147 domain-containing protein [Terriglobales bacterium]